MATGGNHQYITYFRARDPEVFYLEGSYSENFLTALKALVPPKARRWEPDKKRWEIQKEYMQPVKSVVQDHFDIVYYGEGGDYITIQGGR